MNTKTIGCDCDRCKGRTMGMNGKLIKEKAKCSLCDKPCYYMKWGVSFPQDGYYVRGKEKLCQLCGRKEKVI